MSKPTREQMIADLQASGSKPSREQMIADLQGGQSKQLNPYNELYAGIENAAMSGLSALAPIFSPISKVSEVGSGIVQQTFGASPMGQGTRILSNTIADLIPENIKNLRPSDVLPGAFNEQGRGIQLQKGGMLDPSLSEAYQGAKNLVTDPLNVLPAIGTPSKLIKGAAKGAAEVGKTAGSALTGVPRKVMENYVKFAPEIEKIKNAGGVSSEMITSLQGQISNAIKDKLSKTGAELGNEISSIGGMIDVSKVRKPFIDNIEKALQDYVSNPSEINLEKFNQIEKISNKYFASDAIPAQQAFELQQDLKSIMNLPSKPSIESKYSGLSQAERSITNAADKAYAELNKQFETLTSGASTSAKKKYKDLVEMRDILEPIASDPTKTLGALKTIGRKDKVVLRNKIKQIDKELGTNINDTVDLLETYSYLGEPSFNPLSGGGTTSTSRTIAGGAIGSLLGGGFNPYTAAIGAAATSPAALKQGLNLGIGLGDLGTNIGKKLPALTPEQQILMYQTMNQLGQQ